MEGSSKILKTSISLKKGNFNEFEREFLELTLSFGEAGARVRTTELGDYDRSLPTMPTRLVVVPATEDSVAMMESDEDYQIRMRLFQVELADKKKITKSLIATRAIYWPQCYKAALMKSRQQCRIPEIIDGF
jgi:hypothetical protein